MIIPMKQEQSNYELVLDNQKANTQKQNTPQKNPQNTGVTASRQLSSKLSIVLENENEFPRG